MTELFFKAPSEDELSSGYYGLSFDEFKMLSDEDVETLRQQARSKWLEACENSTGFEDEAWWAARKQVDRFVQFMDWRVHGVPDRDISKKEFLERMYHYADTRREANPEYGQLSVEDFSHLTDSEHELTGWVFEDIWADGEQYVGQPIVRRGGYIDHVIDRVGVTYDDLVDKEILEHAELPASVLFDRSRAYVLIGKFAAYMITKRYPAQNE